MWKNILFKKNLKMAKTHNQKYQCLVWVFAFSLIKFFQGFHHWRGVPTHPPTHPSPPPHDDLDLGLLQSWIYMWTKMCCSSSSTRESHLEHSPHKTYNGNFPGGLMMVMLGRVQKWCKKLQLQWGWMWEGGICSSMQPSWSWVSSRLRTSPHLWCH